MAKSEKQPGTKADAIRAILAADPATKTRDVVAKLARAGMKVSANHVYLIKSKARGARRRSKRDRVHAATAGMTNGRHPLNAVLAVERVKALASDLGGMKNLKQLVDLLVE